MILNRFLRDEVTVVRYDYGPKNRQGNATRVKTGQGNYPALLEQESTRELSADRSTLIDFWQVFLPPDADIDAGDQVLNAGRVFEVEGTPNTHMGIREPSHITARLRYVSEVNSASPAP